jgi:hypothetical protein
MTQMVVIHATDNTAPAWNEAHYAETRPDQTSAHFYSDGVDVIQALDTSHIAYGCYPSGNNRSVQFELCGISNQLSDATLRRIASTVSRVCKDYGLPIRKISPTDLVNGVKGICGHIDVTNAWHEGDHTDPGNNFPWSTFIGYVEAAANPGPPPTVVEEDDMFAFNLEIPHKVPVWGKDSNDEDVITGYRWPDEWPDGYASYTIPTVNSGTIPWGAGWLSLCNDTFGDNYCVRVAGGNGGAHVYNDGLPAHKLGNLQRWYVQLDNNTAFISLSRLPVDASDNMTAHLTACVELGKR